MIWELSFLALAIPAVLLAGMSKGGFGGGAAFVATPILALVVEPAIALAVMLPMLMLMDVTALRYYWRQWHWPGARVLMLSSLPGVLLAMLLYQYTNPDVFRLLLGLMAVGFVIFQIARARNWLRLPAATRFSNTKGSIAGFTAGFASFVSHAGGPPVAIFLLPLGLGKTVYQATTVLVFWVINMSKVIPYAYLGFFTLDTLLANLVLAPVAMVGVWLGVYAHRYVSETFFFALTYTLLALAGLRLIWVALS